MNWKEDIINGIKLGLFVIILAVISSVIGAIYTWQAQGTDIAQALGMSVAVNCYLSLFIYLMMTAKIRKVQALHGLDLAEKKGKQKKD